MKIKVVKPRVWNFELVKGDEAWREVVYSARMSGVPPQVKDKDCFRMMIENDYSSALEHIIVKYDIKMSKGNAPEFLEHRMASHSGYSTRYVEVSEGVDKKEQAYEVIIPLHLIDDGKKLTDSISNSIETYRTLLDEQVPREVARYVLSFAQAVGVYHVSMNLRSLINMLSLRLCVRSSPELRCIAAQLYFKLKESIPEVDDLIGCRGYMRGCCPENNVTGVRSGKQHPNYPVCPFKNPKTRIYIPTIKELRKGADVMEFDKTKALLTRETLYNKWMSWE
ncbi:MAG: thymidylate synthase (FAD) [Candidatus Altiarchaeales archaeon ex4484_96]|nr:MAG: thymidylate synthase (FAD) [Candidatus Altiarchaeales archaeon ex4484_96]